MNPSILKLTLRSIKTFYVRYIALLMIVMLSVGFFTGLKITKDAMTNTCESYLKEQHFYDFQLVSTLGFTDDDVEELKLLSDVRSAEGSISVDAFVEHGGSKAFRLQSLSETVNIPSLVAGRFAASENECLADARIFDEADIGTVIYVSGENSDSTLERLSETKFTIVGLANSPQYLGNDRGTTGIGNGSLQGFIYISKECFNSSIYTEVYLTLNEQAHIYSDEYDKLIDQSKEGITEVCEQLADAHYNDLLEENGLTSELAEQAGILQPEVYVLTRAENTGYVSFENDTSIVSSIANIFPIFFIMIAMLVCITTMSRMVDEERTQIGVLKAFGFSNSAIIGKYLLYAGSATLIGWIIGYFLGTWALPQVFWYAYRLLYDFAPLDYLFSPYLASLTLLVSLIGILGSTLYSCRKELRSEPAKLIRPDAGKIGKRILLERFTPLWRRLPFLEKITLRNMFRYKQRLFMMLIGISCCAGLVVTAFGVRDSMKDIGTLHFSKVQMYDLQATFTEGTESSIRTKLDETEGIDNYCIGSKHRVDLYGNENMNSVNLFCFANGEELSNFWSFQADGQKVAFPEKGAAIINTKIADKLSLSVGDSLEIQNTDKQTCTVTISGLFESYVDNFVIISSETYADAFGEWEANIALLSVNDDTEEMAAKMTDTEGITGVAILASTQKSVDDALSCLNYIIWIIVLFSGALAFIVIFNLTNINLAERCREIATVEVLGFYPNETESYVLRENLVLSILASLIGLPLGTLFHWLVMNMVNIDFMTFDVHITPFSYVLAFICTVIFAIIVNLFMKRQIGKIPMAESLKAVE